jgi:hypothetical protein
MWRTLVSSTPFSKNYHRVMQKYTLVQNSCCFVRQYFQFKLDHIPRHNFYHLNFLLQHDKSFLLTHTKKSQTTCMYTYRRCKFSMLYRHTHIHTHKERGESSEFRCDFVSLMNLQWVSTESPFTESWFAYTHVINTTDYCRRNKESKHTVLDELVSFRQFWSFLSLSVYVSINYSKPPHSWIVSQSVWRWGACHESRPMYVVIIRQHTSTYVNINYSTPTHSCIVSQPVWKWGAWRESRPIYAQQSLCANSREGCPSETPQLHT